MTWTAYFETVEWVMLVASVVGAYGSGMGAWNTFRDYHFVRTSGLNGRKPIISWKNFRLNGWLFGLQVSEVVVAGIFVSQPLTPSQVYATLQAIVSYTFFTIQACVLAWLTIRNHLDYQEIVRRFEPDMRPPINS